MQASFVPPDQEQKNPLEAFTVNLTDIAKKGTMDPIIGRDNEIRRVVQILSRRTKNNPILLGDPGVGKTAIIEGLAQRIIAGDVPETLKHKQLLSLDLTSLLAGAAFRGEFEQRLKSLITEIEKSEGKYLLFIDEVHTLIGAGKADGAVDASNMLKPALARGTLHAIGATTVREYRQYIEKDPAFERRFQPVLIDEPQPEDAVAILRGIKEKYETHHGIKISDDAILAAVSLSVKYISDRFLPDKAIDLLDEAAASAKIEIESMPTALDEIKRKQIQLDIELAALKKEKGVEERKKLLEQERETLGHQFDKLKGHWEEQKKIIQALQKKRLELDKKKSELELAERDALLEKAAELKYSMIPSIEKDIQELESQWALIPEEEKLLKEHVAAEDIAHIVSRWTGIPATRLLSSESEKLAHLEDEITKRVIGQDAAISAVSRAIKRSRAGLSEEDRPIGSFLFLGPTGVGKTETAKALAQTLFDDEKNMIRIDMSEYQEPHSLARLIGAPPGYIGYDEGGQLTEAVRRKPYSVVLFDEIEKANPQIFSSLLQVLDDGRLTDGKGRTVNFKNTIIIMTSNLGSHYLVSKLKEAEKQEAVMKDVRAFFRPEFLNRIDSIIVFNPLSESMMKEIVTIQLNDVSERMRKQGYDVTFSRNLNQHFEKAGLDPVYGARSLKRIIQDTVIDELALLIIEGKIHPKDRIIIDFVGGKIKVDVEKVN